jgi:hypothetical protein
VRERERWSLLKYTCKYIYTYLYIVVVPPPHSVNTGGLDLVLVQDRSRSARMLYAVRSTTRKYSVLSSYCTPYKHSTYALGLGNAETVTGWSLKDWEAGKGCIGRRS